MIIYSIFNNQRSAFKNITDYFINEKINLNLLIGNIINKVAQLNLIFLALMLMLALTYLKIEYQLYYRSD